MFIRLNYIDWFSSAFYIHVGRKVKSTYVKLLFVVNKKEVLVTLVDFFFSSWKIYLHKVVFSQVEWGYGCTATFFAFGWWLRQT